MKLTIKTLKGSAFSLEIDPAITVGQLKQQLEAQNGEEYYAAGLKLIHAGKILADDQTVAQCNIKETDFVVAMPGKPKAAAAPKPAAAAAPAAAPAASAPNPAASAPAASSGSSGTAPAAAPPASGGEGGLTVNPTEEAIVSLTEMGFPREEAINALRAAFGNRDRAVEYLYSGIPSGAAPMQTDAPAPSAGASAGSAAASSSASAGSASAPAPPAASPGARAGGFSLSPSSPLAALMTNPQFIQLRGVVHRQPELLPSLLQQLGQHNPSLIQLINDNQEDFYILLNMTSGPAGAPPGGVPIQVTREESEAIDRLCQLGFDRALVIQAYFACDKNENLAANFLFQNGGD